MKREAYMLAGRGLRVFPVSPDAKVPPAGLEWKEAATADGFDLADRWLDWRGNYGVACGSELVVIDIDTHKGGSLAALGELPPTLTVQTPSGGRHLYFRPPAGASFANSVEKLAPGIDVRGTGGYVVGPGSEVGGRPYVIETDAPVAELPASLAERLRAAPQKPAEAGRVVGEVDTPAAIAAARAWLLEALPAVEGEGGDALTYRTACRVLDFGVSPDVATELLADFWNDRCSPPWDWEDLARKVAHAAKYRQDPIGRDHPDFGFDDIEPLPGTGFASRVRRFDLTPEKARALPPRKWIAKRRLMRGKVTVLVAPGGSGKSLLTGQWAAALALGNLDWARLETGTETGPFNVLLVNNEDEDAELDLRFAAIFEHFGLSYADASRRLFTYSGAQELFKVAVRAQRGARLEASTAFRELVTFVRERAIDVVFLDPLVSLHEADENSNSEMDVVMRLLTKLAALTDCAVCLSHHTAKPPAAAADGFAGSGSAGRGASAIRDASRIQLTLFGMSEKDAKRHGIEDRDRRLYARLDDAKENLYLASADAEWLRKVSHTFESGESVGVLVPVKLADRGSQQKDVLPELILKHVPADGSPVFVGSMAKAILGESDLFKAETVNGLCKLIRAALTAGLPGIEFVPKGKTDGEAKRIL